MSLHVEQVWWLVGACVLAGLMVVAARPWRRGVMGWRSSGAVRRWVSVGLRCVLVVLIGALLAEVSVVRTSDRLGVVFVVDVSESVRALSGREPSGEDEDLEGGYLGWAREWISRAQASGGAGDEEGAGEDVAGLIVFGGGEGGGGARAVSSFCVGDVGRLLTAETALAGADGEGGGGGSGGGGGGGGGSDLGAALRLAGAMAQPGMATRMVLISDGVDTGGRVEEAVGELVGRGVMSGGMGGWGGVDVVPVEYAGSGEILVEAVQVQGRASAGSVVPVRVVLRGSGGGRGELVLRYNGQVVGEARPVVFEGGEDGTDRVETFLVQLGLGRVHRFEAVVESREGEDVFAQNNRGYAMTMTGGEGRVLIVEQGGGEGASGALLAQTLNEEGIEAELWDAQRLDGEMSGVGGGGGVVLEAFDAVVLCDVPAEALSTNGQELLAWYVSEMGGGLVMVGGRSSFGAGGWQGTAVADVLPVELDLPEELVVPAAAVMLVLDNSGSMGASVMGSTRSQQEIANEGAARAIETLDERDLVGVITFSSGYSVRVELGPNDEPGRSAGIVRSITPGGGTTLGPALLEARRQLEGVDAQVKHVIVLSDGRSTDADRLGGIAQRMGEAGISVSTIAVGDQADAQTMEQIAEGSGGTYYRVVNPTVLPRLFVKAVRVVRNPMVREGVFEPVVIGGDGDPVVAGIGGDVPALGGLVLTQPRGGEEGGATNVMVTAEGEPVLAYWNAGLGRVGAFTSDADPDGWASEWNDWSGYRVMWTQLVRYVQRAGDGGGRVAARIEGDVLRVRYEVEDEGSGEGVHASGVVYRPDGEREDVELVRVGPGVFEGTIQAQQVGGYVATVVLRGGEGGEELIGAGVGGATRAYGAEFETLRSRGDVLERIAQATGGRVLDAGSPEGADVFGREGIEAVRAREPVWPMVLPWVAVVFVLDVASRRVAWDRYLRLGGVKAEDALEARGERRWARVRKKEAEGGGVERLDEEAALELVRQAQKRRVQEEREDEAGAERGEVSEGLLAAKRRARSSFEEDERAGEDGQG